MKTKTISGIIGGMAVVTAVSLLTIGSCTKEKIVEVPVEKIVTNTETIILNPSLSDATNSGTDKIVFLNGSKTPAATDSGAWKMDKSHSNVMWETAYMGSATSLTGRFNMFDIKCNFNEADPSKTTVKAWVQLSTYNTGEPGRDAFGDGSSTFWNATAAKDKVRFDTTTGKVTTNTAIPETQFWHIGCGMNSMGVKFDTAKTATGKIAIPLPKFTPKAATDSAFFVSKSCVKKDNYYIVTGDFTFKGVTKSVDMKMGFYKRFTITSGTTKTDKAGLYGEFLMDQKVFGVNSTSISDIVKIRVNANLTTSKYSGTNKF